ncbi:MAG: glycosyltransferase [Planctomycetaceae bacterium]|nr:glycosyltransferase [Planctomycetaceae bacterium]
MNPSLSISVVIPVYNAGQPLKEAIDSAFSQIGVNVEVIVVDDGSTCGVTQSILESYGDRIRYFRQKNAGPAAARNLGVQHASHEWIAFLDQDDIWLPEKSQIQLAAAQESGADVTYTNARNFGELERVGEVRCNPAQMPSGDVFEALLLDNFLTMAGVMIRRSVFLAAGSFRPEFAGVDDWDMWLKVSAAGAQFQAIPDPLILYRWHSGSLSKRHRQMKDLREQVLLEALNSPRGRQVPWNFRRKALARVRSTSAWFIAEKEPMQAAVWYAQSIAYWPLEMNAWKGFVKSCLRRP